MSDGRRLRDLWSWRVVPWLLWLLLVGISIWNPSYAPKDPTIGRDFTIPHGVAAKDTMGLVNPSVLVEHHEWLPSTTDAHRSGLYLFAISGVMTFGMALVILRMSRKQVRRWLTLAFTNGVVLALVGLWFFFDDPTMLYGSFPTEGNQPYASFHYKNCWTAYATLCSAIGVGMAAYWLKSGRRILEPKSPTAFYALATPLILLSLPLIQARAGVLMSFLLACWVAVVAIRVARESKSDSRWGLALIPGIHRVARVVQLEDGWARDRSDACQD